MSLGLGSGLEPTLVALALSRRKTLLEAEALQTIGFKHLLCDVMPAGGGIFTLLRFS